MRIAPISINVYKNCYNIQSQTPVKAPPPPTDMFIANVDSISFGAKLDERFSKKFLKELLMLTLPCPVCKKKLIPLELMNNPAVDSLKIFTPHFEKMSEINQQAYKKLTEIAPLFPEKNIQELLQVMFPYAERNLILAQRDILDSLNFLSRDLPDNKGLELRKIIGSTFEEIFQRQTDNEKRFKRKRTITKFTKFSRSVEDKKIAGQITNSIQRLPTSSNSLDSFIVKYAYRDPENIGMKLYPDDFGTLEHIIPESQGGRIVIWECSADNSARGAISINNQHRLNPKMGENIQNTINRLIEIHNSDEWRKITGANAKAKLKEYILAVRNDYLIASKGKIGVDIKALGTIPRDIIIREIQRIKEISNPRFAKIKKACVEELFRMLSKNTNIT